MTLPQRADYVVVGAGIHGLSTAYHLAKELRTRGAGSGADVVVLDKSKPGAGASGHRVRSRPQQLLPAGDERAHAGVRRGLGVRSSGVPLQLGRVHRARRPGAGVGSRGHVRATGADRLSLRAHHRRGRRRRAHEGALPRLARAGRHDLPPRAPGRLRVQRRVGARAPRQMHCGRRLRPRGRRSHRPCPRATTARCPRSRRARERSRSASRS